MESEDTKDGRSGGREVESGMKYDNRKYVLIRLQALQPGWNIFVEIWTLMFDLVSKLSGLLFYISGVIF